MDIVRLPEGQAAPIDADCISIDPQPDGTFALTGSLLGEGESVAIVSPIICSTHAEAEEQGIAWAAGCEIATLYVATASPGAAA